MEISALCIRPSDLPNSLCWTTRESEFCRQWAFSTGNTWLLATHIRGHGGKLGRECTFPYSQLLKCSCLRDRDSLGEFHVKYAPSAKAMRQRWGCTSLVWGLILRSQAGQCAWFTAMSKVYPDFWSFFLFPLALHKSNQLTYRILHVTLSSGSLKKK